MINGKKVNIENNWLTWTWKVLKVLQEISSLVDLKIKSSALEIWQLQGHSTGNKVIQGIRFFIKLPKVLAIP